MLPLSKPHFSGAFLLLVVSNLLLWEKTASVPACITEGNVCSDTLVTKFNNAIQQAEVIQDLADKVDDEFYKNPFSSGQFATLVYPNAKKKYKIVTWEYLPSLRSTDKNKKFLAMFNLSNCLGSDIIYIKFHLKTLMCRITGKEC
ncbi:prolactin-8A9-like [Mastomys coucha]|uniref:prolactin-8A9-like n=1 Tax=Mastomys coucha TaxID=35658 RepID=UPI0012622D6E|nr:prolactin-8A9-like [Mastomys coucha]